MQAVIALCHFCENHGPRVVMTCQPMRDVDDKGEKEIIFNFNYVLNTLNSK